MDTTNSLFNGSVNIVQQMLKNQTQLAKQEARQLFIEHCKSLSIPKSYVIVQNMDALSSALYVVLIIMTTLTIGMFIEEIYFLRTNIKSTYRRRLSVVQLGIPPIFTLTSMIGCFFPAGYVMIDFVTSVYFGVALHCLLVLKVNYYGGLKSFLKCFETRTISVRTGPLCCCLVCLPELPMNRKNFRFLWYMTFQSVLIRPITLFMMGIFDADGSVPIPGILYQTILVCSMMTGMWALVIFRRASMDFISGYRIQGKFFVFQMVLLVANLQPAIVHAAYHSCSPPFGFQTRQIILNYQITIIEFFILSLFSRCYYRRSSDNDDVLLPILYDENNEINNKELKQIVVEDTAKLLTNDITVELKKEETIESIKQNGDN